MFKKLSIEDFNEIKDILEKDSEGDVITHIPYNRYVWFSGGYGVELYLKCSRDELIISRINLNNKRSGIATKILKLLKEYAINNNFKSIVVESTLTKEMNHFCLKHNFEPQFLGGAGCFAQDGEFYGNYKLDLK